MKLIFSLIFTTIISFPVFSSTRIAIVSDNPGNLQDLLATELSSIKDSELLERSEITKILAEQKISSSQLIDEQQALNLGKMISTDLFAVLQTDEKKNPFGLIVFDSKTGVRYWDSALPEADADKIAKFAAEAIKTAVDKRRKASEGKLKYLSLLSVRNADLPREKDPFCKAVGILLMRQLGNSPDIVVLEREHLQYLNSENLLAGAAERNSLLPTTLLLSLEIRRNELGKEGIRAEVIFPEGSNLSIESENVNPVDISHSLVMKTLETLNSGTVIMKPDIKAEANKYFNEFQYLKGHNKWIEAQEKIEANYVLSGENTLAYIRNTVDVAREILDHLGRIHSISSQEEKVSETLDMIEKALDMAFSAYSKDRNIGYVEIGIMNYVKDLTLINLKNKIGYSPEIQARMLEIADRAFQLSELIYRHQIFRKDDFIVKDEETYDAYVLYASGLFNDISDSRVTMKRWTSKCIPLLYNWHDVSKNYADKIGSLNGNTIPGDNASELLHDIFRFIIEHRKEFNTDDCRKLKELFSIMLAHPSPPFRIIGKAGDLIISGYLLGDNADDKYWIDSFNELIAYAEKVILEITNPHFISDKGKCYRVLMELCKYFPLHLKNDNQTQRDISLKHAKLMEITDFIMQNNELNYFMVIGLSQESRFHPAEDVYTRIEKCIAMLDDKNTKLIYSDSYMEKNDRQLSLNLIQKALKDGRENILTVKPEYETGRKALPWKNVIKLFPDSRLSVACPRTDDKYIYSVISDSSSSYLIRYPYRTKGIIERGKPASTRVVSIGDWPRFGMMRTCLSDDVYYLGTADGIFAFPKNLDKPFKIDGKDFPSKIIHVLTYASDKLYFVAGEPHHIGPEYILSYDLKKNELSTIATTGSKTIESPFKGFNNPFRVTGIHHDPPRKRILFLIDTDNSNFESYDSMTGLWEYNYETSKWKHQLTLPHSWSGPRIIQKKDNNTILISDFLSCIEYNLCANNTMLIYDELNRLNSTIHDNSKLIDLQKNLHSPFLSIGEWLWSSEPFSRTSMKTGEYERFPLLSPDDKYHKDECLEVIDDGKLIIISSFFNIWILELDK